MRVFVGNYRVPICYLRIRFDIMAVIRNNAIDKTVYIGVYNMSVRFAIKSYTIHSCGITYMPGTLNQIWSIWSKHGQNMYRNNDCPEI
jgi:hypothetical protein